MYNRDYWSDHPDREVGDWLGDRWRDRRSLDVVGDRWMLV